MNRSQRSRLTLRQADAFEGETLFARVARAVCEAECLPRKELFESWEMARRVRRRFRGGRIVDLAAGHGLVGILLLVLDDTSPEVVCVDRRRPESAARVLEVLVRRWPRLEGRVRYVEGELESVSIESSDLVVSAHACGALTDRVLDLALAVRARVAVLPCCHDAAVSPTEGLEGWMDAALAIDATRAHRLRAAGYEVLTQTIPEDITPKNRLLLGATSSSRAPCPPPTGR